MAEFKSFRSYFDFAHSIASSWRYVWDAEQSAFLDALIDTSTSRIEPIPLGSIVYRAQLGCDWPESSEENSYDPGPMGYSPERMMPRKGQAQDGRANPRGIPCLYVATKEETALAEVRPWIGAYVSIAQLRTTRELKVVNATSEDQKLKLYFKEPPPPEREKAVWRDIDRAFARPVERVEHLAEYAPTQVIAEVFRRNGIDGIGYRSSLGPGHNIAFFDLGAAEVLNCTVHHVSGITFQTSEAANRYFVSQHYAKPEGNSRPGSSL